MTSTVIAAIASIVVAVFLGSTIYGQLTIAMIPITVALMFTDLGIGSCLVKYIAQYRTEYRMADIETLLKAGLVINSAVGLILLLSTFLSSGYLAKTVFNQS